MDQEKDYRSICTVVVKKFPVSANYCFIPYYTNYHNTAYYLLGMKCRLCIDLTDQSYLPLKSPIHILFVHIMQEFVEMEHWAHLDIAGVMDGSGGVAYLGKGMTGMHIQYRELYRKETYLYLFKEVGNCNGIIIISAINVCSEG